MENVLFKSKIRNAKMKILQVASALTICLGGIFGSTLPVAANTVSTNVTVKCTTQTSAGSFTISGKLNVDVANRSGSSGDTESMEPLVLVLQVMDPGGEKVFT